MQPYKIDSGILKRLVTLFLTYGDVDYIGEPVSIVNHSIQAAYHASRALASISDSIAGSEVIIAALLHDIGHVLGLEAGVSFRMGGCGVMNHESIGEDFLLKLGFNTRIARLIGSHVNAKRYLCYKNQEYYNKLSPASQTTLGYQGGPMSEEEAITFENDPDFINYLLLRKFDEAAKVPDLQVPSFESYFQVIVDNNSSVFVPNSLVNVTYVLSDVQLQSFHSNSVLKVTNLLQFADLTISNLINWVDEISNWQSQPGDEKWLSHYEENNIGERIMCRSENFVNYHQNMSFLAKEIVLKLVSQLFNEDAVLFKEKVNYKLPGGAGFSVHQDTPAYIGLAEEHITCMIAIDDATVENGCLQVAKGKWSKNSNVPLTETGIVTPEYESTLTFEHVECKAGDVLLFNGFLPHRSNSNTTQTSRRALFLTYNPLSQGDYHDEYYQAKHKGLKGFNGSHAITFIGDFQGKIVD
eukprot:gene6193-8530_t